MSSRIIILEKGVQSIILILRKFIIGSQTDTHHSNKPNKDKVFIPTYGRRGISTAIIHRNGELNVSQVMRITVKKSSNKQF